MHTHPLIVWGSQKLAVRVYNLKISWNNFSGWEVCYCLISFLFFFFSFLHESFIWTAASLFQYKTDSYDWIPPINVVAGWSCRTHFESISIKIYLFYSEFYTSVWFSCSATEALGNRFLLHRDSHELLTQAGDTTSSLTQSPISYPSAIRLTGMRAPRVAAAQTGNPIWVSPDRISGTSALFDQIPLQCVMSSAAKPQLNKPT